MYKGVFRSEEDVFSLFGIKEVFVLFVRDLLYNDFNDKEEEL